jgi:hypothetical protein
MYQSSGQCVLVALDSALLARLVGRLQRYEPNGDANVRWRRDLRGLFMACDMDEITDRLDQIIQLIQNQQVGTGALDDEILQALLQLLAAVGAP